ncbi:MAG TPA: quinone-dependent dihydroorotate dehydrogenase [Fimbriimonadaceae bacterium]|nr:quinone-dependent dihydroorotate dehydrogenase [Fimbriimonadaceae bacterium]
MGFYGSVLRKVLFRLDPEKVHDLALWAIGRGLVRGRVLNHDSLVQELLGCRFPNPLGLAAGFDKNGLAARRWPQLGFGFVELGTVTPIGQPGNPRPRLFRLAQDRALINRMGFNNQGADPLASRLTRVRERPIPIGINLGKGKRTPPVRAAEDYAASFGKLRGLGQYVVVNVSSPNTPGLRGLQEKGPLLEILAAMRERDEETPVLIKIAPDLDWSGLDEVLEVLHASGASGLIATNTTLSRVGLQSSVDEAGGLSGAPLKRRSDEVLAYLAQGMEPGKVLIGVGGVFTGRDMLDKMELGAHLVQTYTGFVYGGPLMAFRTLTELVGLLDGAHCAERRGARLNR